MNVAKPLVISNEFIFDKIFKRFYFSSVFAILCGSLGQIAGNVIVGNFMHQDKLAVMSLILPVNYIFTTIGNLLGIGGSTLCAKLIGKRDGEGCNRAFTVTYILNAVLCVFFSVLVIAFLPYIVPLLGTPKELFDDVKTYCGIISAGGVFTAGTYLSFNFLRLDGKPVATTMTFVIMTGINIILDIVLAPFGVGGIALATILGNVASTVFGLVIVTRHSDQLRFRSISARDTLSLSLKIFGIGSPGATENISMLLKSYVFNRLITSIIGASALSYLAVVNSINNFSYAITFGSAGALVPIIGVFYAEKDSVGIRKTVRSAVRLGGILLVVFMAAIIVFAPSVARMFGIIDGTDEACSAIKLFAVSLPLALLSNVLIYLHLANGHTAISNLLTVLKNFVFLVGLAFVFMKVWSSTGLWLSFAGCEAATLLAAAVIHLFAKLRDRRLSYILLLDTEYEKNGTSVTITTEDDDDSIGDAVEKIRDFCKQNGIPAKESMLITLSMEEMLHMAAEHSTRLGDSHVISARVITLEDILVLRLRYVGELFNPIEYYEQKRTDLNDVDAMLELADCLGVKMVTDTCTNVDYRTTFGINNLTVIV